MLQRLVWMVAQEGQQALRHAQLQIVRQGKGGALLLGKARQQLFQQIGRAVADIHPLRHITHKSGCPGLRRGNRGEEVRMRIQQGNAAGNLARG